MVNLKRILTAALFSAGTLLAGEAWAQEEPVPELGTNVVKTVISAATDASRQGAQDKKYYLSSDGKEKTELTDQNQDAIFTVIKDLIFNQVAAISPRTAQIEPFIADYVANPDHYALAPVENGFVLCADDDGDSACSAGEQKVTNPNDNSTVFTDVGRIISESIPAQDKDLTLTVEKRETRTISLPRGESLDAVLAPEKTYTNKDIFCVGAQAHYDPSSGEFFPGAVLCYNRILGNRMVLGVVASFAGGDYSRDDPRDPVATAKGMLYTNAQRDYARYFPGLSLNIGGMFEEGYGILLSVGIQKETSREGSSRHEEIRDAQGNVLETYQHDDAQPKETETRYQPVMAIQVPIKIAEEIFQPRDGLWLIPSAGVGCDPSFDRCDLQGSLSVGYTPSSTEE